MGAINHQMFSQRANSFYDLLFNKCISLHLYSTYSTLVSWLNLIFMRGKSPCISGACNPSRTNFLLPPSLSGWALPKLLYEHINSYIKLQRSGHFRKEKRRDCFSLLAPPLVFVNTRRFSWRLSFWTFHERERKKKPLGSPSLCAYCLLGPLFKTRGRTFMSFVFWEWHRLDAGGGGYLAN